MTHPHYHRDADCRPDDSIPGPTFSSPFAPCTLMWYHSERRTQRAILALRTALDHRVQRHRLRPNTRPRLWPTVVEGLTSPSLFLPHEECGTHSSNSSAVSECTCCVSPSDGASMNSHLPLAQLSFGSMLVSGTYSDLDPHSWSAEQPTRAYGLAQP